MKKILLVLTVLFSFLAAQAQDVIVKKDGSTIVCRVIETTKTSVIYQAWATPNATNQVIALSQVARINYEQGKTEDIQQVDNHYTPNNQSSGERKYNDNTLLNLHNQIKSREKAEKDALKMNEKYIDLTKKAKKFKRIGYIAGGALVAGGTATALIALSTNPNDVYHYIGIGIAGLGVATGVSCLIHSHNLNKKANSLLTHSILSEDFILNNGNSLSAGIDLINDKQFKTNAIGIGLRFNF
ncbi:MAG: hypothetical protein IK092_00265 [Muribaculaceae bacterium]|nr:hypothetical protein [Muribaculaceae bacterium]